MDKLMTVGEVRRDPLLTVKQVATYLSCHHSHVYDLLASGALPHVDLGRRMKRVRESAVEAYIERCCGEPEIIEESRAPSPDVRTPSDVARSLRGIQAALKRGSAGSMPR